MFSIFFQKDDNYFQVSSLCVHVLFTLSQCCGAGRSRAGFWLEPEPNLFGGSRSQTFLVDYFITVSNYCLLNEKQWVLKQFLQKLLAILGVKFILNLYALNSRFNSSALWLLNADWPVPLYCILYSMEPNYLFNRMGWFFFANINRIIVAANSLRKRTSILSHLIHWVLCLLLVKICIFSFIFLTAKNGWNVKNKYWKLPVLCQN